MSRRIIKRRQRARHPWQNYYLPAPKPLRAPTTPIDEMLQRLWPDDLHKHASALLGAPTATIRDWRRGKRKPPQWAIDRLLQHIDKITAVADTLRKQKGYG